MVYDLCCLPKRTEQSHRREESPSEKNFLSTHLSASATFLLSNLLPQFRLKGPAQLQSSLLFQLHHPSTSLCQNSCMLLGRQTTIIIMHESTHLDRVRDQKDQRRCSLEVCTASINTLSTSRKGKQEGHHGVLSTSSGEGGSLQ